jgi:TolB-like protein/Flp pilus assembly protein TadD
MEFTKKAIAIDESHAEAHGLLGFIYTMIGEYDKGIDEAQKAVSLNPNSDMAYQYLGFCLRFGDKPKEAIPVLKKAIRLNPFAPSTIIFNLGLSYLFSGQYEEAITECKRATTREPNNLGAHIALTVAYGLSGRDEEARSTAGEVLKLEPKFTLDSLSRSLVYKNQADKARFIDALRKAGLPDKPPLPLPDKPSIAVLAFTNMSGNPKDDFFGDGLAEGVINGLSKSEHIFVIARNSSFTYKGKPVKVKQVAQEMGVRYVIEGSIQREGERLRITVQFIDAVAGHHLFSERYDRDLKGILNLQDEITMKVLTAVQVKLTSGESARISEKGTKNLDAYLKVLEARELKAGTMNKERVERAMQLLDEAIALDPEYAYAYSILSTAHCDLLGLGASDSPRESLRRAVELGKKAVALDELNSSAHANLAFPYIFLRECDKAIEEAEKGVSLSPNSAAAYFALGTALYSAGRPQEAIPILQKCVRLSPIPVHSQVLGFLANSYVALGQYEEGIATYKNVLQIYGPDHLMAHLWMAVAYIGLGRENEARAEAAEVLRIDPKFSVERFVKNVPADPASKDRMTKALLKAGLK